MKKLLGGIPLFALLCLVQFILSAQETKIETYPSHPQKEIPKISLDELHNESLKFKGTTPQTNATLNLLPSGGEPEP